jgi:hypothetical protein
MRNRLLLALATAFVASHADAQVSAPAPNTAQLHCGVDTMEVYLVRGEGRRKTGTIVDACRVTDRAGVQVVERVYSSVDALLGSRTDTIVDRWKTLMPVSYRSHAAEGEMILDWSDRTITGRLAFTGQTPIEVNEPSAGSYNSASFDLILRASPLAIGYTVDVPSYIPKQGVKSLTAKVVGEESAAGRDAWRVDADFSGMPVTFWISKDRRRLLKQVLHVAPGTDLEFVLVPARSATSSISNSSEAVARSYRSSRRDTGH